MAAGAKMKQEAKRSRVKVSAKAAPRRSSPALRTAPTQARAKATVEHLVVTAAQLLADVGADGFNTNRLAERAGVTVPTVYRYFPNKMAVLEELARGLASAWDGWFDDDLLADGTKDWREVWCGYIDAFVSGIALAPAGLVIRAALHSQPELQEIEVLNTQRLARRLTAALMLRDPQLEKVRVAAASELLLTTAIAVFDQAFTGSARKRTERIDELKKMHLAYLSGLLEYT